MNKPFEILVKDLKVNLVTLVNQSGVPLCVTEMILKDIYAEVVKTNEAQLKQLEAEYVQTMDAEVVEDGNVQ